MSFLNSHIEWLNQSLKKIKKIYLKIDDNIEIFGNIYNIILNENKNSEIVTLTNNQLLVSYRVVGKEEKHITKFLSLYLRQEIIKIADVICHQIDMTYTKICIKEMQTKWGSCSSQGNLSFNWKLVFFEKNILEYVVIHEICHLKEMNHSKRFWQLVQDHCPQWTEACEWLKSGGVYIL